MRNMMLVVIAAAGLLLACPSVQAADYSQMSTAELAGMRDTMQKAPEKERRAFQEEWERRVRMMTTAERRQYLGPPAEAQEGKAQSGYGRESQESKWLEVTPRREQLVAPPASVAPRRFGERNPYQERKRQIGPRRFAPTPDLNGGSPFNFNRDLGKQGAPQGSRR